MRTMIPAIVVMLVTACTAEPEPEPEPEPIISRHFTGEAPVERRSSKAVRAALGAHGIRCGGFEGSIKGRAEQWRTSCSGTAAQWSRAEADIARLVQEGILVDRSNYNPK